MPRVSSRKFFSEQSSLSRVKAEIVVKYVLGWAKILLNSRFNESRQAAYIDLFSGPGSYEDGQRSTPLLITEAALTTPLLRNGLRMFFNDIEPVLTKSLQQELDALPGALRMASAPVFTSQPATTRLIDSLKIADNVPQFFFLDQFGWADVTPSMIQRIFRAQKVDCIFFFKTARVIAAVTNPNAEQKMKEVFGDEALQNMRFEFKTTPHAKEEVVLQNLKARMLSSGAAYFQSFPFRTRAKNGSKHHLIYLGKNPKGLELMKDIMAKKSSVEHGGVPVMGYMVEPFQPSLFLSDPIPALSRSLMEVFRGRTITVGRIFQEHHVTNEHFLLRNYQEAVRRLEAASEIITKPSALDRPQRDGVVTMSESVQVTFPQRGRS